MKFVIAGFTLLGVWMIVAFGLAIPNGWAHLPLAVGVACLAIGVVTWSAESSGDGADRE